MEITIRSSMKRIPGASPCPDHSLFAFISRASIISEIELCASIEPEDSLYERINLDGQWKRKADFGGLSKEIPSKHYDDFEWNDIFVPNNYGLEGALQRHYDPVWYRRKFQLRDKKYVELHFQGVDYLSEVWLNGIKLGDHEGYFAPFYFDITQHLEDLNVLVVKVTDPCENLDPEGTIRSHLKKYIKGTMNYHDSRPGGLPGKLSPKWSSQWGQSLTTGGITQSVYLKCCGTISIIHAFVTPLNLEGLIHVAVIIENKDPKPFEAQFNLTITDSSGEIGSRGIQCVLQPGPNRLDLEIQIPQPQLWVPFCTECKGEPHLYQLKLQAFEGQTLSDEFTTPFGIRTVNLTFNPWKFEVNGHYIFLKAVNYIPRQHFADVDEAFYRRDLQLIKEAYLNSVGVHAHIQRGDCYTATDKEGILVFQDFALQWGYDSSVRRNPGFREKACQQISEMVYLLYNHPSVVYWCCHNEPPALFIKLERDEIDDNDNRVLDELLEKTVQRIDQSRPIHRASGLGEDLHVYDGSLGGGSIYDARKRKSGFVSEFGFWTIAETSKKWGDVGWPPTTEELIQWSSRCSFFGSTSTFIGHPKYYPNRKTWIKASLLYGAFLAKYQTEVFRSRKGNPYNAIRWHFFSDWWGYAGGGLVDVDRVPKLPYYWYKAACRPILLIADLPNTIFPPEKKLEIPIIAVNDYAEPMSIKWEIELLQINGFQVIVGDQNAASLGGTGASCKRSHKISLPLEDIDIFNTLIHIQGTIELPANGVTHITEIKFQIPRIENCSSYLIQLKWLVDSNRQTNWAHFIGGNLPKKMKPGLHSFSY
ncbi:MAG: glycoside hydrolase family 2 protein [Candidatus Helarchaeota archaeon]